MNQPKLISAVVVARHHNTTPLEILKRVAAEPALLDFLGASPEQEIRVVFGDKTVAVNAPDKTYPTPLNQLSNATKAAARAAFAAATLKPVMAEETVIQARQAICTQCDKFDVAASRCTACGCKTNLKLRLATERCPLDKWGAVTE